MADNADSQYNNSNRAFLQAFIARSTLTFDEAKPLLAAIFTAHEKRETFPEDVTQADFNSYISAANNAISPFDLEIRSTYHQTTRSRIYALVNSTSDPITQLATIHTPDEISFLKRVLDAMFETYNTPRHEVMAITSMQAIKLHKTLTEDGPQTQNGSATQGSAGQSLTMGQAEKMMKTLVEEGWLEKSIKGFYSLSPRALMELRGWLWETYNDLDEDEGDEERASKKIKQCFACKEIITTNFFRTQSSKKCPLCRTDWTGSDFVGERAAMSTQHKPAKRRSGSGAVARRASPVALEEDEEVDEAEEQEDD
ncbi:hypothetical protein HO133_001660 [Letharia lupina]|uniref:Non-structural maintenance of chromosomes element 1 homolog n=1 Tax=Letharia lupina TaxID=560253 RepID=A0A8H6FAU7_9LECA|nr:uncharacterized protein HO133_001660 [Letharia lupina]KAF6221692.1 hypothetical protein HO133_001660 [Letharia lupina]